MSNTSKQGLRRETTVSLDENKGEIREITRAVGLCRFILCNASWCLKFQTIK